MPAIATPNPVSTFVTIPMSRWLAAISTPKLLKHGMGFLIAASLFAYIAAGVGVYESRHAVQVIGRDTTPSIVSALKLRTSMADLDANECNLFLIAPESPDFKTSVKAINDRWNQIGDNLIGAAQNITYGEAERGPILKMQIGLVQYQRLMTSAHQFFEAGDAVSALARFRDATNLMHERLLTAADDLCVANQKELQSTYDHQQWNSTIALTWQVVSALILISALVYFQWILERRTRRRVNPGLAVATLIAVLLLGYTVIQTRQAGRELKVVKEDAFDSIYALWEARAVCYDLNGDESRWLLDPTPSNQKAFFEKVDRVAKAAAGSTLEDLVVRSKSPPIGEEFHGYLVDELNNITFIGEADAAQKAVRTFVAYYRIDAKIRELERGGRHAQAVALDVGNDVGGSNHAFGQFDEAMDEVININQSAFDAAVTNGFSNLAGLDWVLPGGTAIIVGLIVAGLRPRMREYAV